MSWSSRKKSKYIGALATVVAIVVAFFLFSILYNPPTCQDGKQNQGEEGVDCGGPCQMICGFEIIDPIIHWSRLSKTLEGVYSVTTLVENPNVSAEARSVPYILKIYDDEGLLVNERAGEVFIPADVIFPVFDGAIETGNRAPQKAIFEFTQKPNWTKTTAELKISISNIQFFEKNNLPRVSAIVNNDTVKNIKNVELIVLVFDKQDNLINSSKTFLDLIEKNSSEKIVFTWPIAFDREATKIDIFPVSK